MHRSIQSSNSFCARLFSVLVGLDSLWPGSSFGQTFTSQKVLGRYQQFLWLEQHGLPQNTVQAITRTRDGYLWLGTLAGAARFDGARFTVFDNGNTPEIKASYITSLREDRQGNLWFGSDGGGLACFRDGRFRLFTSRDGLPSDTTKTMLEDRNGNLWFGTYAGLTRFKDGRFTVYTARDGLPNDSILSLAEDGAGGLWVGSAGGLARFKDDRFTVYTTRDGLLHNNVKALCLDRAGNLWIGTNGGGLNRFRNGRFTHFTKRDGLASDSCAPCLRIARETCGSARWMAASAGSKTASLPPSPPKMVCMTTSRSRFFQIRKMTAAICG